MNKEKGYYDEEATKLRADVQKLEERASSGEEIESWTMKNSVRNQLYSKYSIAGSNYDF